MSDGFTRQCIEDVIDRGDGLVPPSARAGSNCVVSRRLAMFVAPGGDHTEDHLGGKRVEETHLAAGWVSIHVRYWTALMDQGLFNFDIKFKDTGVDQQGVYLLADLSSTMFLERALAYQRGDRRLSIDHLCVNEIVRNGQFFSRFANGGELVDVYAGAIFEALQFDVRPLTQGWTRGDQESPPADEAAVRAWAMMERGSVTRPPRGREQNRTENPGKVGVDVKSNNRRCALEALSLHIYKANHSWLLRANKFHCAHPGIGKAIPSSSAVLVETKGSQQSFQPSMKVLTEVAPSRSGGASSARESDHPPAARRPHATAVKIPLVQQA